MLYTQAKAYLVGKLKEAGLKTKPYTTMKSLSRSMESHVGAVLPGTEMIARNGSKTIYQDQEGAQHKRRKLFDRNVTFQVVLGDYTDDKVESTEEDHPLKAEIAVTVNITFRGGVYRDIDLHRSRDYRLEDIGKNNGKEPANGN